MNNTEIQTSIPRKVSDLQPEAEFSEGKWHTGKLTYWEQIWERNHAARETPFFASVFRLKPGMHIYHLLNLQLNERKCRMMPSVSGWHHGKPGVVAVDLDCETGMTLDTVVERARTVIRRLDENKVNRESFRIFLSGKKGLHIQFLYQAFGPLIDQIGPSSDWELGHERAVYLALKAICGDVRFDEGTAQTLRLFRVPNSRHDEKSDRYKVPITVEELLTTPADVLIEMNRQPRPHLSTVPSTTVDDALVQMLKNELEADNALIEKASSIKNAKSSVKAISTAQEARRLGCTPIDSQSILYRIEKLCRYRPYLEQAWNSVPWAGKENSQSAYDFRVAKELYLVDWTDSEIRTAVLVRPKTTSVLKNESYLTRTLASAKESAEKLRSRRPAQRVLNTSVEESINGNLRSCWVDRSPLWRNRVALGFSCKEVYYAHVEFAIRLGWKPTEGQWSDVYYIDRSQFCGENNRMVAEQTLRRCHELLKCVGLLKLIKKGDWGVASQYKVRIPKRDEELLLLEAGKEAKNVLSGKKKMTIDVRREAREAARLVFKKQSGMEAITPEEFQSLDNTDMEERVSNRPNVITVYPSLCSKGELIPDSGPRTGVRTGDLLDLE